MSAIPTLNQLVKLKNATDIFKGENNQEILGSHINYIRNSVKVIVDAYDGTMQFFYS